MRADRISRLLPRRGQNDKAASVLFVGGILLIFISLGCAEKTKNMRYFHTYDDLSHKGVVGDSYHADSLSADLLAPEGDEEKISRRNEMEGDRYLARGKMPQAYVRYEKALKGDAENARLHYKKGLALLLGRVEPKAIQSFEKVLTLDPGYAPAYAGLGQAYFQQKNYVDAKTWFLEAVTHDDRLWRSHMFLGILYDYEGQNEQAAVEHLRAIETGQDKGLLYNNLGVSYTMAGQYEKAVKAFQTAIDKGFTEERAYNNLGTALSKAGRYKGAIDAFSKGGSSAQAYNNLGCVYMAQGDTDNAKRSFRKAIHLKSTFYTQADENLKNLENNVEME